MDFELQILDWQGVEKVYYDFMQLDFPPCEIKPIGVIKRLYDSNITKCIALVSDGTIYAYAMLECVRDVILLDYFAVCKNVRAQGIGGEFLLRLQSVFCGFDSILLEIERVDCANNQDEHDIRLRRRNFYLRNGVEYTGVFACTREGEFEILALPINGNSVASKSDIIRRLDCIYSIFFENGDYLLK